MQLSQFSAAAWFKTSTNFASEAFIGIGSDSSGNNMNYGISMTSSDVLKAGFEAVGGAHHFVTSPNTYNDGQWHYAVVTYDGSTVILYIDGVRVGVRVGTKLTASASPETYGTGEVDEVRVWNNDLTAQQVADAFARNVNTAGQVLYLSFDSASLTGTYNLS